MNGRSKNSSDSRITLLGTLVSRVAGPIDQAALMMALLLESGYTANYMYGQIRLYKADIEQLLGTDDSAVAKTTEDLLTASQIPVVNIVYTSGVLTYVDIRHVWIRVTISGTQYVFDPAYKTYYYTSGINIGSAIGWTGSSLGSDRN